MSDKELSDAEIDDYNRGVDEFNADADEDIRSTLFASKRWNLEQWILRLMVLWLWVKNFLLGVSA